MDPEKIKSIVDQPQPMSQKEVQQILGLWNFDKRFIPSYTAIVAAITGLLREE